jgi:hypothetical protein
MLMKRVWGHLLVGCSLLAAAGGIMPACAHDDSTLFVQNVLAPQLVTAGQACVFTSDPTQPKLSSGVLDLDLRNQYDAVFLVGNQMVPESNSAQLQTETSTVTLQGAIVRITNAAGVQLKTFTRLASATVYPASGNVPGYTNIAVTLIDSDTLSSDAELQGIVSQPGALARLITYVKFFGYTLGGKYVESGEFVFPVDVCRSCLIAFSAADISPFFQAPNCKGNGGTSSSSSSSNQVPCVIGQDFAVDCASCLSNPACNPSTPPIAIADAGAG